MSHRIHSVLFMGLLITGLISLPAAAQSGRTFYIDYANGSNGNSGTTKSSPWKSHPYMQTGGACTGTGNAPAYAHQTGDHFIFAGGVTWPAACFQMTIAAGGSSASAHDVYTVDQTWFSGGGFTKPVFDLAQNTTIGGNNVIKIYASNITIDGVEIKNQKVSSNGVSPCDAATINFYGVSNITVSNALVHDWVASSVSSGQLSGHDTGSICGGGNAGNYLVDSTIVHDQNGKIGSAAVGFGGCFRNIGEVANSVCHNVGDGDVGYGQVHDSEFYNITNAEVAFDPAVHTNVIEVFYLGDGPIYNNLIHDNNPVGLTISVCAGPSLYNNVFWNNGNAAILIDPGGNGGGSCGNQSTAISNIYNNTIAPGPNYVVRGLSRGITIGGINLKNNHWITDTTPTCFNNAGSGCENVTSVNQANNVTMTTSTATSQGYTAANKLAPTSSSNGTVKTAISLSGLCSGTLSSLCSDLLHNPRLLSWDAGAYEFGGSTQTTKPNPPSGLAAFVQ